MGEWMEKRKKEGVDDLECFLWEIGWEWNGC